MSTQRWATTPTAILCRTLGPRRADGREGDGAAIVCHASGAYFTGLAPARAPLRPCLRGRGGPWLARPAPPSADLYRRDAAFLTSRLLPSAAPDIAAPHLF
ncbi:unnamed protein product [Prorocentrum cordatum]|uniref:Uncharacterized protein n=1 Tax=Prorocentrum cordatum TaxID=2364126 RepID=A0ABN9QN93_9DINO|nr:unnamed protein product [Polarella glacialis]